MIPFFDVLLAVIVSQQGVSKNGVVIHFWIDCFDFVAKYHHAPETNAPLNVAGVNALIATVPEPITLTSKET